MYLYLSKSINTFGLDALGSLLCGDLLSHFTGAVSGVVVYLYFDSTRGTLVSLLMCSGMALLLIELNKKWKLENINKPYMEEIVDNEDFSEEYPDTDLSEEMEEYLSDDSIYSVESIDYGEYESL